MQQIVSESLPIKPTKFTATASNWRRKGKRVNIPIYHSRLWCLPLREILKRMEGGDKKAKRITMEKIILRILH